ncbi:MAG: FecR domain-containing protein [Planctomycetota bacterium]|nr:FecR domain-containing protein [Planctomycetota bacterium]
MPVTREQGRLVHVLLREQLGGEAPPDLTARVLERIPEPRRRRRIGWRVPVAAAAGVLLALGAWALLAPASYPAPRAGGDYRLVSGQRVERGSVLAAGEGKATVELGGYCRLALDPHARVRLAGGERAEQVFLEAGAATCEVDRNVGTFTVQTEVGTVSVKGTKFTVRVLDSKGDEPMVTKRLVVHVLVGAVLVSGAWGSMPVQAGQEQTLTAAGAVPMAADTKPVRIAGQLTKIEGKVLTITDGGKDTVVTCNDATKVKRDGQEAPAKFEDLQVGQHVRAYCTPTDHVALHVFIFKAGV